MTHRVLRRHLANPGRRRKQPPPTRHHTLTKSKLGGNFVPLDRHQVSTQFENRPRSRPHRSRCGRPTRLDALGTRLQDEDRRPGPRLTTKQPASARERVRRPSQPAERRNQNWVETPCRSINTKFPPNRANALRSRQSDEIRIRWKLRVARSTPSFHLIRNPPAKPPSPVSLRPPDATRCLTRRLQTARIALRTFPGSRSSRARRARWRRDGQCGRRIR